MTTQELLTLTDSFYPNVESNTNKVAFMNLAQNKLSPYFGKIIEDATLSTTQNIDSYTFPTTLYDVTEIISLAIHNSAKLYSALTAYVAGDIVYYNANTYTCILASTGNLPTNATYFTLNVINRYDYTEYFLKDSDLNPASANGYYQIVSSTGAKKLCIYPAPTTTGLVIIIRYQRRLTALSSSSLSAEPDFDSRYHVLLAYYACAMICSTGASPDSYNADHYMRQFEDGLDDLWKLKNEQDRKTNRFKKQNPHWNKYRSFNSGF